MKIIFKGLKFQTKHLVTLGSMGEHIAPSVAEWFATNFTNKIGKVMAINDKFILVSGFGQESNDEFIGSSFLYSHDLYNNQNSVEPVAYLRDKESKALFGHSIEMNKKYVIIGDPSSDCVHVYLVDSLIGSYLHKWNSSLHRIKPPKKVLLEIH